MQVNDKYKVLIGAGSYHHNIPETIRTLMSRSEFLTAYTPYQPEMAQGTLQGIFEYQTLTARLLGMDVANASMYDGASALAEALLMGLRIEKKKTKVAVSAAIHPHYRQVARTYLQPTRYELVELPVGTDGRTDLSALARLRDLAAVAIQSPNFFGVIEDLEALGADHPRQSVLSLSPVLPSLWPTACSKIQGSAGPISSAAKARVLACRDPLAVPRSECLPAGTNLSAICLAGWSVRPLILMENAVLS